MTLKDTQLFYLVIKFKKPFGVPKDCTRRKTMRATHIIFFFMLTVTMIINNSVIISSKNPKLKYEDSEKLKADLVNSVVFKLHQIKQRHFFWDTRYRSFWVNFL